MFREKNKILGEKTFDDHENKVPYEIRTWNQQKITNGSREGMLFKKITAFYLNISIYFFNK